MSDYGYGLSTIEGRVVTLPSWKEKYCTHHMLHHLENENPALKWTKNHRNLHVSLWLEVYRVILVCTCWWHKMKWIQFIRWTERDHTNKHFENVSSSARRKMYSRLLLSGILNIRGHAWSSRSGWRISSHNNLVGCRCWVFVAERASSDGSLTGRCRGVRWPLYFILNHRHESL